MATTQNATSIHHLAKHSSWRVIVGLLLVASFLYVVLPHLSTFKASFSAVHHAQWSWLLLALVAILVTYVAAAGVYYCLAKKPIRFFKTILVQMAGTFTNRIVPAGIGALSINYDYLRKQKHTVAQAGSVIAANNLLGIVGNLILLAGSLVFAPVHHTSLSVHHSVIYELIGALSSFIAVFLFWSRHLRSELFQTIFSVGRNISVYRVHPLRLMAGLLISMCLTLAYAVCLLASAHALHVHLAVDQAIVVMTAGVAVGTLTPTPGGLVGTEAGLFAGCIGYHITSADALAIVLTYRLFTYWLVLPFGAAALFITEHLGYI